MKGLTNPKIYMTKFRYSLTRIAYHHCIYEEHKTGNKCEDLTSIFSSNYFVPSHLKRILICT